MSYQEKQEFLQSRFCEISSQNFYRELFPAGTFEDRVGYHEEYEHTGKGNGFLVYEKTENKKSTRMVFDDLSEIQKFLDNKNCYMSPLSYFGATCSLANARLMFAMTFDLDDVGAEQLSNLFDYWIYHKRIPMPTYVVNSGGGVHLYYVFTEPLPLYPQMQSRLKELKYALTSKIWNGDTSQNKSKQYQGISQPFRIVGSYTKNMERVTAWRTGDKISVAELSQFVDEKYRITDTFYHSKITLEEARKKYPEWYQQRIELKRPRQSWTCNRKLYDWWLRRISEVEMGHRYHYVKCLVVFGIKCGIDYNEVKKDAYEMQPILNKINPDKPFTRSDVKSALEMFQDCWVNYPRKDIEKDSGLPCPENKRNGRTQKQHLVRARAMRDINQAELGTKWNGRKSYKDFVFEFLRYNPNATAKDFCEITNMSKRVFYKYKKEFENDNRTNSKEN